MAVEKSPPRARAKKIERASRPPAGDARCRGEPVVRAVLEATIAELAANGFTAMSIEAVAERAGVNKTTIYRRFPTKVDLVVAALQAEKAAFAPHDVDHGDLESDLVALLTYASHAIREGRGKSLMRTLLGERADPEVAKLAERLRREGQRVPKLVLQRAIARGELSPETDLQLLLHCLFGALIHRIFLEDVPMTPAEIEQLTRMILFGVLRPAARKKR